MLCYSSEVWKNLSTGSKSWLDSHSQWGRSNKHFEHHAKALYAYFLVEILTVWNRSMQILSFFPQVYIHQREKSSHCQLEKAQVPYQSKPSGDLGQNVSVFSGQEYWLNISKTESFSLNHGALPGVHFFLAPRWKCCCYILWVTNTH